MIEGINNIFKGNNDLIKSASDNQNINSSFSQLLKNNLNQVNQLQRQADNLTEDFVLGKTDNIHKVTIATEKAKIALNLTTAIQNKVLNAYEEIMRIQV